MSDDRSILQRLDEAGHTAPRVALDGTQRNADATARYEIVGEIARGGVGVVHHGRDNDVGRDVALKVLRDEHLRSPELVQRFVEEAQIGGQLQHPGIVPVYELGLQADRRPYFAMKLVKGETLAARLAAGTDSRRALLAVFREVCRTLAYAHSRGVIHRDLKPSNIMIGNFGEVQVVDWGFAKVLRKGGVHDERLKKKATRDVTMISTVRSGEGSDASLAGSVMGTPAYMPPEQAMGRVDDLDERSDIFCLGAILCEILTGEPPYESDLTSAAQAQLAPAYARLDACGADERLVALCKRCLQPLPKDRPATATALADEVAAYLADAETRAHRAQVRALEADVQAQEQTRARRQTRIVGGTIVALLALAVGGYFWNDAAKTRREHERRTAIETALRDAERARATKDWTTAEAAAERAVALGHKGALVDEIRAEAERERARIERERDDDILLERLERIRSDAESSVETKGAQYAEAFKDIDDARLAASKRAEEFAAHMNAFALWRKRLGKPDWEEIARRGRRLAPGHEDVWAAILTDDVEALLRITSQRSDELPLHVASSVGAALATNGRYGKAIAFLQHVHDRAPGDFHVNRNIAILAFDAGEYETSQRHAAAALALRPRSAAGLALLGIACYKNGEPEGALTAFRRAVEIAPDYARAHHNVAAVLNFMKKYDEAIASSRRAIELKPNEPGAYVNLCVSYRHKGVLDEALAAGQRAVELNPDLGNAWGNLGLVLGDLGDHDKAEAALRKAVELAPEVLHAHVSLARTLVKKGKTADAIAALRRALEVVPNADGAIGSELAILGDYEVAIEPLRKGIEARPSAKLYSNLGVALFKTGRFQEGIEAFRESVRLDPNETGSYINLSEVLLRRDLDSSVAASRRALEIEPNNAKALQNLAIAYYNKGDYAAAVRAYRKAIALAPRNADLPTGLANSLFWLGSFDEAAGLVRKDSQVAHMIRQFQAMEKDLAGVLDGSVPKSPQWALAYATLAHIKRDYEGAVRLYARALAANPNQAHLTPACAAALAGDRKQALTWLRTELKRFRASSEPPWKLLFKLATMKAHVALKSIDDKAFWAEVDALYERAKKLADK